MNTLMVCFKVTISKAVRFMEWAIDTDSNIMVLIIVGHFIKVWFIGLFSVGYFINNLLFEVHCIDGIGFIMEGSKCMVKFKH